jgi:transcription elongation factor
MKKITVNIDDKKFEILQQFGGKFSTMATMCLENFIFSHRSSINELNSVFEDNELKAMIEAYKGTSFSAEWAINKDAFITHTIDAAKYDGIDKKWKINSYTLANKLKKLHASQILSLQFELYRFWNINESYNDDVNNFVEKFNG